MIDININGKNAFDIEFQLNLQEVAEAVKADIEDNLMLVRSWDGSPITPLSEDYAARKRKVLKHDRIFDAFRTGNSKLINSVRVKKITDFYYEVDMRNQLNRDIMYRLNEGIRTRGPRRAFGFGPAGMSRIKKVLEGIIKIV